jgi:hypothetical protein
MAGRQRLVRHGHLPESEILIAVRCPRVRDHAGQGSERIRVSSAILPPYARRSKSLGFPSEHDLLERIRRSRLPGEQTVLS